MSWLSVFLCCLNQLNENSVPQKAGEMLIHKTWHIFPFVEICDCFLSNAFNHSSCNFKGNELPRGTQQTCAGEVGPCASQFCQGNGSQVQQVLWYGIFTDLRLGTGTKIDPCDIPVLK